MAAHVQGSGASAGIHKEEFHDKSVMKVTEKTAPHGELGQKYLASGIHIGMITVFALSI